jgi:serine/threonine protein kinase
VRLNAAQLKQLAVLSDQWLEGSAVERDALRIQAAQQGDAFERAFNVMVAQLNDHDLDHNNDNNKHRTDATLLPLIPETVRDRAIVASGVRPSGAISNVVCDTDRATESLHQNADTAFTERSVGQHVGPYRLLKELGRGGMGVVWLAERADGTHARQVALKMPLVDNLNWLLAARFARERNILASLEHSGIARLYDAGVDEHAQPYIAIEYVAGQPITHYVRDKKLKPEAIVRLFIKVIEVVAYAHTQLVIHRDIKPTNILVDAKGEPHLLDFGIAKLLDDDESMSADATQQVNGVTLGTASDVYSLGIVLYELLTGSRPYRPKGPTRRDLELAILEQEPGKPSELLLRTGDSEAGKSARSMRGDLDTIVLKALKKDPKQRYATAQAFADDLKRYIAFEPVTAKPDSEWYRVARFVRRNRVGVSVALALGAAIAAGVASTIWQTVEANRQRVIAEEEVTEREKSTRFVVELISQYAPKSKPMSSVELLDLGLTKIAGVYEDDYEGSSRMAALLASRFVEMGERTRARQGMEVALDYALKSGKRPIIADTTGSVAALLAVEGDVPKAKLLLQEAISQFELIPASNRYKDDVERNIVYTQAAIASQSGDGTMANAAVKKMAEILRRNPPDGGPDRADGTIWNRQTVSHRVAMRFADALETNMKSIAIDDQVSGGVGSQAFVSYAGQLNLLLEAGDPAAAVAFFENRVKPKLQQPVTELSANLFSSIVLSYARHGQVSVAETLLRERSTSVDTSPLNQLRTASARFQTCVVSENLPCIEKNLAPATELIGMVAPYNPAVLAGQHWLKAVNAQLQGNNGIAMVEINEGLKKLSAHTLAPSGYFALLMTERARIELKNKDAKSALTTARAGLDYLTAHHQYEPKRCIQRADLLLLEGAALEQLGALEQGKALNAEAEAILRTTLDPTHPRFSRRQT